MAGEDWRCEVDLDDDAHGFSLGERLRSLDLDDEARRRLGRHVTVTRDGSRLFLYTNTREEADEAVRVVEELAAGDRLTAEIRITRWHPAEEEWKDASLPLPRTEGEREAERDQLEARERREVEAGGGYEWHVHVRAPDGAAAEELERRLREQQLPVQRRWRYLTVGALTEEDANELAARISEEIPGGTVGVEPTDVPSPLFVLARSWL